MENDKKEETAPPPNPLPPPTHATGYHPPARPADPTKPTKVNPEKIPAFYFSGNVELTSDGNGNLTITLKQH